MKREISAGIVIFRKDKEEGPKFLLLYHGHGYWNFPKGKIEKEAGERAIKTALREVKEETGINPNELRIERFRVADKYTFYAAGEQVSKIVILFLAQTKQTEIKISKEHEGYGWFAYRDAYRLLRHKNLKDILRNTYNQITGKTLAAPPVKKSKPA